MKTLVGTPDPPEPEREQPQWQFGIPDVYAAMAWARAYKDFLTGTGSSVVSITSTTTSDIVWNRMTTTFTGNSYG